MAVEYPDVMNDITDARQRFESGAVQYLAEFSPASTPAGSVPNILLTMQSVMDVAVQAAIRLAWPEPKGALKRLPQPPFQIFQPEISLKLESAEAVQLAIPVYIQPQVPPERYPFTISVRSAPVQPGNRIRSRQGENRLGDIRIRNPQGLGITQVAAWGFQAKESQHQPLSLDVTAADAAQAQAVPGKEALQPKLSSLWNIQEWDIIPPARREVNDRRIYIMPQLTAESLYLPFMKQSEVALGGSGVRLHVGEALFLAKILTYTVTYMASKPEWLDCLLVPIYAMAQVGGQPTDDVVWLLTQLGYMNVLELAIALSFSLAEEAMQRPLWDAAEQRAVRDFIVSCLDSGEELPSEFLYLPLLLGGLQAAHQVVLEGEDVRQSLQLLAKAKSARSALLADPDLQTLNTAFDHILAQQGRT